jgi:hypothetical protein
LKEAEHHTSHRKKVDEEYSENNTKNARHNIQYHRVEMAFLNLQNEIKSSVLGNLIENQWFCRRKITIDVAWEERYSMKTLATAECTLYRYM